jgi:hypothetical protein
MAQPKFALPGDHALWAAGVTSIFQMLRLSAAITDGWLWRPIHNEPSVTGFELEHGVEVERERYNAEAIAKVQRTLRPVLGHHAGFSDWFVPIVVGGRLSAILVTGPFARQRPSSSDTLARWRRLSGRVGRLSDPEFEYYVDTTLSTLVLSSADAARFGRLIELLGQLLAGAPRAARLLARIDALWEKLEQERLVERTWEATEQMIDVRTARRWSRPQEHRGRAVLGLPSVADHVLVGLFVSRKAELDALDERLERDALQRECVALARQSGHAVAGRLRHHGVVFLSGSQGSAQRKRRRVLDLAEKARVLARRFGLNLHAGLAASGNPASCPRCFNARSTQPNARCPKARVSSKERASRKSHDSVRSGATSLERSTSDPKNRPPVSRATRRPWRDSAAIGWNGCSASSTPASSGWWTRSRIGPGSRLELWTTWFQA